MICPSCKGEKQSMGFVDGYDEKSGKSWGDYRAIQCHVCKGTGEVDDGFAARRVWGDRMRRTRIALSLTLRDIGTGTHIPFSRLSQIEHGIAAPTERERQGIEKALGVSV